MNMSYLDSVATFNLQLSYDYYIHFSKDRKAIVLIHLIIVGNVLNLSIISVCIIKPLYHR